MMNGSDGPGRGFFGRFGMVLIIAAFGLITYFSQEQENPVTGKKQHVSLTPSEEISLGLQSAPRMANQMGGEVSEGDPRHQEVQKIGDFIVNNTEAHKGPWQFKFHLLADDKTVNAFALPGGQIFITLGLYEKLQTEAQLAGVLSHEIGHVIERHTAEQMAKNKLGQTLVVAVGAGGDSQSNTSMMVAAVVNQMMQLRYSRTDESEADIWGLKLMSEIGYNPRAMIEVMQILKAIDHGGNTIEMFQTHPNPDLRIQQIEAYLKEHPPNPNSKEGESLVH
jgi:beta-barrel assembly-enhancing protease